MLTRVPLFAFALILIAGLTGLGARPAWADTIYCPPYQGACEIIADNPGGGGDDGTPGTGGSTGGGQARCLHEQLGEVSCHHRNYDWFNPADTCYYERLDLPAHDPAWHGNDPAKGDLYRAWCWAGGSAGWQATRVVYLTSPPPGFGGLPSPLTLALRAVNRLGLRGPDIHTAPDVNGAGLVGLPVWLWTEVTATTWGPASATASVPGMSVTATAKAARIEWHMGDGHKKTCANPGTAHDSRFGGRPSPTCGHVYTSPSRDQRDGRYTITAVTTWIVTWAGGGQNGTLTVTRQSTSTLQVDELQVVTVQ